MTEDILTILTSKKDSFSKGQKRIAAYITESYDKAAFMTASKLGKIADVSESTVVRFAMELGYDGYPSMQRAMQEMVLDRLTPSQRIGLTSSRLGHQDVVSMVLQADVEKIRQTNETVSREDFRASVDTILNARRIYVLGIGSSSMLAQFFAQHLSFMFPDVRCITSSDVAETITKLIDISAEDAVVAFSFPKYSSSTIKAVDFCRKTGAKVIAVTNSSLSPISHNCDRLLVAKSDMVSFVDSLVGPLSLVNALVVALASAREENLKKNFETMERVMQEYNLEQKGAQEHGV